MSELTKQQAKDLDMIEADFVDPVLDEGRMDDLVRAGLVFHSTGENPDGSPWESWCLTAAGRDALDAFKAHNRPEWRLCPRCRGEGTVVHEALSVWTKQDRFEDPEGFEEMMAGTYDVQCPRCGGRRVVEDTADEVGDWEDRQTELHIRRQESGWY